MRILQLSDLYPPVIGGTERHTQRLARELAARGHDSLVATLELRGSPACATGDAGERVFRLDSLATRVPRAHEGDRPYHPPFADPVVRRQLGALLRRERPDVVYAHNWMIYSAAGPTRRLGIPLVYVLHDYCMACPAKSFLRESGTACAHGPAERIACGVERYGPVRGRLLGAGLTLANRRLGAVGCTYVAISESVAASVRVALGPDTDVRVVPTFVAAGLAESVRGEPRPDFLPDRPYLLFVGALGTYKGTDLLLDAYARLADPKPALVMLATRGHGEQPRLPAGVTLRTDVAHHQVMLAWRDCLFGVVPSRWAEPFGQVALEALTMGRPVVASDAGGLRDIVRHERNGLLFAPGSVDALAAALRRLSDDEELRDRLGAAAADGVERFTAPVVAGTVEALLADVVARARSPWPPRPD